MIRYRLVNADGHQVSTRDDWPTAREAGLDCDQAKGPVFLESSFDGIHWTGLGPVQFETGG